MERNLSCWLWVDVSVLKDPEVEGLNNLVIITSIGVIFKRGWLIRGPERKSQG